MTAIEVICPFCGEGDFDLIGLKIHITRGWCQPFEDLDTTDIYLHGRSETEAQ